MSENSIRATLIIEVIIFCPKCGQLIDLVTDTKLNEEGWLLDSLLQEDSWAIAHENFECYVNCTFCSTQLSVKGVDWKGGTNS